MTAAGGSRRIRRRCPKGRPATDSTSWSPISTATTGTTCSLRAAVARIACCFRCARGRRRPWRSVLPSFAKTKPNIWPAASAAGRLRRQQTKGATLASRRPLAPALAALVVLAAALIGLAVLVGAVRQVTPGPLVAELRLDPMRLPSGVALDPVEISDYIEKRLTENAERDVAIRMGLGPENSARLMTIIIPRLVNSTVISRMIDRIPPLGAVVALNDLRTTASIAV